MESHLLFPSKGITYYFPPAQVWPFPLFVSVQTESHQRFSGCWQSYFHFRFVFPGAHFIIEPSGNEKGITVEENTTRNITFKVVITCRDVDDVTVGVSRRGPSPDWKELCIVWANRKNQFCQCNKYEFGNLCQITDTFDRNKLEWRLKGVDGDQTRVEEKTFNVNVTCKYSVLYYVALHYSRLRYISLC